MGAHPWAKPKMVRRERLGLAGFGWAWRWLRATEAHRGEAGRGQRSGRASRYYPHL